MNRLGVIANALAERPVAMPEDGLQNDPVDDLSEQLLEVINAAAPTRTGDPRREAAIADLLSDF